MIHEEEDVPAPALPEKSKRRSARVSHIATHEPPPYSQGSDESAPDRKSEPPKEGIRDNEWLARRGGWNRLVLAALIFAGIIVGLGVGLTYGLHKG